MMNTRSRNSLARTAIRTPMAIGVLALVMAAACSGDTPTSPSTTIVDTATVATTATTTTTPEAPTTVTPTTGPVSISAVVTNRYRSPVTLAVGATTIVLRSRGVPDHVTPYWGVGHALYEAPFSGQTLTPNGNIAEQTYTMTIAVNPTAAASKEATTLGPIGMAVNGVAIYNDREGGNVPVDAGTLRTIDRAGAHTSPGGTYHYHFDNEFISYDDANLFGFLRDGFPIYGRKDQDGSYPSDLDSNGGHVGTTADFATAIYHYHATRVAYMNSRFYILKAGSYHGTKGTFTF